MSQTPSRRRPLAVDTPGSARSNTSTTSTTDRATLLDRIEDLDLQIHDLRRQIKVERERRRSPSTFSSAFFSTSTLSLSFFDPDERRDEAGAKAAILDKLKAVDDEALTRLLTASREGLVDWVAGGKGGGWMKLDARWIPSKSVGVEGTGSGSDIDRRLQQADSTEERKKGRGVREELGQKRHEQSINDWLTDRQRRTSSLIDSLAKFTHFDISTITQSDPTIVTSREGGEDGGRSRKVHIKGTFAQLFPLNIQFSILDPPSTTTTSSPQIQSLQITLPHWLESTLNHPHNLYTKLISRSDLPSILLMLRTMIPLLSLRRALFVSIMEQYTHLVRDHVRAFEETTGVDFSPWSPHNSRKRPSSSSSSNTEVDENLAKSLIIPSQAETFILRNNKGASLQLIFAIRWNRFGHASPHISARAKVPDRMTDSRTRAFLDGFEEEVQHLLKLAIAQDGIIGLPDKDEEEAEEEEGEKVVGRWGVGPALHALIKAFFGLDEGESASDEST